MIRRTRNALRRKPKPPRDYGIGESHTIVELFRNYARFIFHERPALSMAICAVLTVLFFSALWIAVPNHVTYEGWTQVELVERLGEPSRTYKLEDGRTVLEYQVPNSNRYSKSWKSRRYIVDDTGIVLGRFS